MTDLEFSEAFEQRVLDYTRQELGPASERYLQQSSVLAAVQQRVGGGQDLEDAVLAVVHGVIAENRRVADEFAAHFLYDLMNMGKTSMATTSHLRRFLDTGDLVMSVFGDLWGDLASLKFESRNQFKTLFTQRMNWKAADKARRMRTASRREDRRVMGEPEDLATATEGAPLSSSIKHEERERLILIMLRLNERERQLLTLHLRGASIGTIAEDLGLTYEAARKALARATERARSFADRSQHRGDARGMGAG